MPKYIKKPVVVEAEEYRVGLEDGYHCGKPYIRIDNGPFVRIVDLTDYIIGSRSEGRDVISKEEFQSNYELVEEPQQ